MKNINNKCPLSVWNDEFISFDLFWWHKKNIFVDWVDEVLNYNNTKWWLSVWNDEFMNFNLLWWSKKDWINNISNNIAEKIKKTI